MKGHALCCDCDACLNRGGGMPADSFTYEIEELETTVAPCGYERAQLRARKNKDESSED